jgi:hypothetical protein
MDIISAYREAGTYRGAAAISGTTHKTVKRVIARHEAGAVEAADPESKGIVENLVGYAKADLMVPQAPFGDLSAANAAARSWCADVNGAVHSEICSVPAERLVTERELLGPLPSLRASIGKVTSRKVDRLSCVRVGSARYSVPARLIGTDVRLPVAARRRTVDPGRRVRSPRTADPGRGRADPGPARSPVRPLADYAIGALS